MTVKTGTYSMFATCIWILLFFIKGTSKKGRLECRVRHQLGYSDTVFPNLKKIILLARNNGSPSDNFV
jgi:hypothetical protein